MKEIARVVLVGTGRMAHGLIPALKAAGTVPVGIYGRSEAGTRSWLSHWGQGGDAVSVLPTLPGAPREADAYLLAVSDDALEAVSAALPPDVLRVHFAGSGSAVLSGGPAAVVWPIHTFTGRLDPDWSRIHVAVSARDAEAAACTVAWAQKFASSVTEVKDELRIRAHIAAVFAANYTNRMFTHAQELADEAGIPWDAYVPMLQAVCTAAATGRSAEHQTGPAHRGDRTTLALHTDLLSLQPARAALYAACAHDLLPPDAPESSR